MCRDDLADLRQQAAEKASEFEDSAIFFSSGQVKNSWLPNWRALNRWVIVGQTTADDLLSRFSRSSVLANERLQHGDGMLLLPVPVAAMDMLAQQQLALSHLDDALPLLEEEDCLEDLQRIDSLLNDWDQSFPLNQMKF